MKICSNICTTFITGFSRTPTQTNWRCEQRKRTKNRKIMTKQLYCHTSRSLSVSLVKGPILSRRSVILLIMRILYGISPFHIVHSTRFADNCPLPVFNQYFCSLVFSRKVKWTPKKDTNRSSKLSLGIKHDNNLRSVVKMFKTVFAVNDLIDRLVIIPINFKVT